MKPPRRLAAPHDADLIAPLDYEIFQEKAATLARLGRRLDEALRELSGHDASGPGRDAEEWQERRRALVATAGEAL